VKKIVLLLISVYSFATNILVLNSYSTTLSWTEIQSDEIEKILKNMNLKNSNIYVESMDTKRFKPTDKYFNLYFNFFKNKYKHISFDIIITTDDNALNFVRFYKNSFLFKNAKVFFQGVNNLSLKNRLDKNIYAGILEKKEPLLQLRFAKKVMANLKVVYVFSDSSVSGNKTISQYRNKFKNIKNIKFVYINSSDFKEIVNKLKHYNKNSVLMGLTISAIKKDGRVLTPTQFEKELSKIYKNPILVHNGVYSYIDNTSIVGGVCTDAQIQSRLNMKKLKEYLNNKPMKDIGFQENNTNRLYLNKKNLEKFGLNTDNLKLKNMPFKVVNKPKLFYEIYKWQILTAFFVLLLVILFLIVLAKKNRELYLYSKKIEDINKNLEIKIKEAVEENTRQLELLQQQAKLAAMGEMIGMIAHQWRQPLNVLGMHIQFLPEILEDEGCDTKVIKILEEFADKNMETIKFMSHTIDDFRNFFKKDKEKVEFDISQAIQEVLNIEKPQIKTYNIELISNLKSVKIIGYNNEFKQVILNLVSNSIDVIVKNSVKNGFIKVEDYELNDEVIILVEDNGGGIPQEFIDKIFEPYFTTKEQDGTGLGLYMSNEIVKRIGGSIEVKNSDSGAKFIIRLKK